jgi:hypothetical protein
VTLGEKVGRSVGTTVSSGEGMAVGWCVGPIVGSLVRPVGPADGETVGKVEGVEEGLADGLVVGASEGASVGWAVVGCAVNVGSELGCIEKLGREEMVGGLLGLSEGDPEGAVDTDGPREGERVGRRLGRGETVGPEGLSVPSELSPPPTIDEDVPFRLLATAILVGTTIAQTTQNTKSTRQKRPRQGLLRR